MENVSAVTSFILSAYFELQDHIYLYSLSFLLAYIFILLSNSVLILAIYFERSLHEPMYLLICNLSVNGVYGGTSLLPSMLGHLMSHNYEVSLTRCVLQLYCLHSYATIELTILAVMSYDRYVAISHPLHYHLLMSPRKVSAAITLVWLAPLIYTMFFTVFAAQHTFCGRIIEKVFCTNFHLVKLSCFDTTIQSFVGLALLLVSPCSQFVMILFSYVQILRICLSASKESQIKAIQTCTPHLLALVNFVVGGLFEIIQSRFNMSHVPHKARVFMSLYILIFPPLFNPVVYGISIQSIRVQILKLFSGKKRK
ncbi:olfactory receptor 52L1-like [Anguilla rostrata]|uniref:olfactory receptor 52L1-like n=1 Tax=Anguilla rostrata TaxID=7938 RepID=UPI0015B0C77D|nr:olfactory receptor 52L1-like isoform X3 [Anguilla anguilla]